MKLFIWKPILVLVPLSTDNAGCLSVLFLIQLKQYDRCDDDYSTCDLWDFHYFIEKDVRYYTSGNGFKGCGDAGSGGANQVDALTYKSNSRVIVFTCDSKLKGLKIKYIRSSLDSIWYLVIEC